MEQQIHDSILALVNGPYEAAHPGVPIVYDNRPFDWNSLPPVFVTLEIKIYDGNQIGMAASPKARYAGCVYVTVNVREGTGIQTSLAIKKTLTDLLKFATAGPVRLQAAVPVDSGPVKGWHSEEVKVPFYADEP